MVDVTTNWNEVRQQMTNDISSTLKDVKKDALNDINERLLEKGLNSDKTEIKPDSVVFITDDKQEFEDGKIYFDEVYEEVSDDSWLESL